jgi:hypothetical protein
MSTYTFHIPEENLYKLEAAIARINKRAAKLGMPLVSFDRGLGRRAQLEQMTHDRQLKMVDTMVYAVQVTGEQPVLAGWRFLAKLDHMPGTDDVIVIGEAPAQYQKCPPNCDHCKVDRNRSTTYVLQEVESGTLKQVGSTCLKDFFNGDDPMSHASFLQYLATTRDELSDLEEIGSGEKASYINAQDVLEVAAYYSRVDGYITAAQAETQMIMSTGACVRQAFFGKGMRPAPTPDDDAKAQKVMDWLTSDSVLETAAESNYMHNLCAIASSGLVKAEHIGILSSAIVAHDRALERLAMERSASTSEFIGAEKERIENHAVTVLGRKFIPADEWGSKTLYNMLDDNGNRLAWFCRGSEIANVGDKIHISGTVSKHKVFRDVKQTELLRVTTNENKLFDAIDAQKDTKVIEKILQAPVNVNQRRVSGHYNITPLMMASLRGHAEAVEMLLSRGASPEFVDEQRNRAVHFAAAHAHFGCLKSLSSWGANMDIEARPGESVPNLLAEAQKDIAKQRYALTQTDHLDLAELPVTHWANEPMFPLGVLGSKKDWEKAFESSKAVAEATGATFRVPDGPVIIKAEGGSFTVVTGQLQVAQAFAEKRSTIEATILHARPLLDILNSPEPEPAPAQEVAKRNKRKPK